MATKLRGFRALGIVGFAALTVSLVSACNGNGNFAFTDNQGGASTTTAASGDNSGNSTGSVSGSGYNAGSGSGSSGSGSGGHAPTTAASSGGATPQCGTADLSAHLGAITWIGTAGNGRAGGTVPVIYNNTSGHTCVLDGFGGVDLHGPSDPNGPVYSLRRGQDIVRDPASQATPTRVVLAPKAEAHTTVNFQSWAPGEVGSLGSTDWTPTTLVATPPNQTTSFTLPWFQGVTVLRQDSATVVNTYIDPVQAGA